ncbi:MAG: Na+/H+ antiporter subunit E [Thioclava marina]|jgi:multisubunit potassium/proton antiporter, PhaE subunit (2.A.63.1.1)|uniref:Na+/H+ antiporter subunit E n=1 Tax=Thioclava marina TaxID=1915077 RepID=A0ABX3MKN2_9RHOB|nr:MULTISPECIES: Na+/H+ antiporter subunit E [Thioclava]TNE94415.1 MAG: Na+/H+ antiporter subunit E [Paracoccaceae bacterium]MBC7145604.1 Na+/H+ antiporter subunit E [Thioclava marina]MBD3803575.1 Na+/H+ antiporter subunit E [Thioclava sp.]OOY12117.1 Na+/H+ antiporter subunit E [Thioclava marina]OOY27694.1 Na+/H+ antiporter subunit E [Thioclava sp. L04-15]
MIRKILPHPYLTLTLTIVWLLLANAYTINSLVFAILVGLAIPWLTAPYWPARPRIGNPVKILEYILVVFWDIIVANITVAKIVLFMPNSKLHPAWVSVPLDIVEPEAITVLAGTITMTPGTLTAELAADGHSLLVHCLHAPDADAVRDEIKTRYEARLKEIFE